ncbi:Uncharacterised protein [Mycobacterium tuberculosis]|nr:Uncharacterised protein [Mycobacterium tuberculosis]
MKSEFFSKFLQNVSKIDIIFNDKNGFVFSEFNLKVIQLDLSN